MRAVFDNHPDIRTKFLFYSMLKTRFIVSVFVVAIAFLAGCPAVQPTKNVQVSTASSPATSDTQLLARRIDKVLADNLVNRQLSTDIHGAWQILHGILAYGREFRVQTAQGNVIAINYLLRGGAIKGFDLRSGDRFANAAATTSTDASLTRGIRTELDPGTKLGQGHRDQWLAYLTACNLPVDQLFPTADGPRRLDLWLRQMEWDVPLNFEQEYSWTLMSLMPFRATSHRWKARDENDYSIESLLRSELNRLSPESACGGSHRLVAIAITLNKRKAEGATIDGVWADAQAVVDLAIEQAFQYQNEDGTFSSNYFERSGWSLDLSTAIGTTGHTLEFIAVAGSDELQQSQAVVRAATSLCRLLDQTSELDLECGALYHALSGLKIYRQRIAVTAST